MKITTNIFHNSQTTLPAGIFLYPDRFHSMHTLRVSTAGQRQILIITLKTQSAWHFYTSPLTRKKYSSTLFLMFSTNSVFHSIQKSQYPRTTITGYLLNSGFTNALKSFTQTLFLQVYEGNLHALSYQNSSYSQNLIASMEKTTHAFKLLLMDYILRLTYRRGLSLYGKVWEGRINSNFLTIAFRLKLQREFHEVQCARVHKHQWQITIKKMILLLVKH